MSHVTERHVTKGKTTDETSNANNTVHAVQHWEGYCVRHDRALLCLASADSIIYRGSL